MRVHQIVPLSHKFLHRQLLELDNQVGRVCTERLVAAPLVHNAGLLREAGLDRDLNALGVDYTALSLAQHLLSRILDLLHRAVVELEERALERYDDVFLALLGVDPLQLALLAGLRRRLLDVRVRIAEKVLEDLKVAPLVHVARKLVDSLRHTILGLYSPYLS